MKNIKPKKQNDYNILLNLAKNLTEDLEEGIKLSCELINKNYIERNKHTFYQEYNLYYNPKERTFVFDQNKDNIKGAFNLIRIFPKEYSSFSNVSNFYNVSNKPLGTGLLDNKSLFKNYYSFNKEDELKINQDLFKNKEELSDIILTAILNYDNSVSNFFKKSNTDAPVSKSFSSRELCIYIPLLSSRNKELCFIHYLRFLTEPIDFLTSSITQGTYRLKEYLDQNNNDIISAIRFFLSDIFSEEDLSQFINNISINEKEFSIVYKNKKIKSIFIINNKDRERILKKISEDVEDHFLIEKIKTKQIDLIDYFENTLLIPIRDIYKIFDKSGNKVYKNPEATHLYECIKFFSIGCIDFTNDNNKSLFILSDTFDKTKPIKQLFEIQLYPEAKQQVQKLLKRLNVMAILSN